MLFYNLNQYFSHELFIGLGKYLSYSDPELVRLMKESGDHVAYEELYYRYWEKLLVQALLKLKEEEEAEEIVQEVFMDIWERREAINIRYTFHTYIASCVKYKIMDRLNRKRKNVGFVRDTEFLISGESVNQTEDWLDYETTRQQIEDTVKGLPEKCQLVFRLSREDGYSQKEIAEKLQISTKTVETHITKALKAIRSSIKNILATLF